MSVSLIINYCFLTSQAYSLINIHPLNIKHQTSNIKHQTLNIKHQTSNIKYSSLTNAHPLLESAPHNAHTNANV